MRPRLTCLCLSRDVCPVHDERDDDETDDERREREAYLDDLADARMDRARDERDERGRR